MAVLDSFKFKYKIEGISSRVFDTEDEIDLTLKEFQTWVTNHHRLVGLVTIHLDTFQLTDPFATVYDILTTPENQILEVHSDKSIAVAVGGCAKAGQSFAQHGNLAVAMGGFATGGTVYEDGTLRGGKSIGGDAKGDYGTGGDAKGGMASSSHGGGARAGRSTGGDFQVSRTFGPLRVWTHSST
ncbi:hypothetical protein QBC38DRAFT_523881 [Podospora fimiseda]|uniref:Uncharacterized protein n=1 Tax=Podospora fimiseda TaxID=252190 RepID=A0AAN7BSE4_9PEZI|nr:hypothetical protein QBC38DRAFT_523881 [Podospora fimiseda]